MVNVQHRCPIVLLTFRSSANNPHWSSTYSLTARSRLFLVHSLSSMSMLVLVAKQLRRNRPIEDPRVDLEFAGGGLVKIVVDP